MATIRKRTSASSDFSVKDDLVGEKIEAEDSLEATPVEIIELPSEKEKEKEVEQRPFVEQEITPTPDVGLRFLEVPEGPISFQPTPESAPQEAYLPRRYPRNIPKFVHGK